MLPLLTAVFAAISYDSVLACAFFFFLTVFIYGQLYRVMSLNAPEPAARPRPAAVRRPAEPMIGPPAPDSRTVTRETDLLFPSFNMHTEWIGQVDYKNAATGDPDDFTSGSSWMATAGGRRRAG